MAQGQSRAERLIALARIRAMAEARNLQPALHRRNALQRQLQDLEHRRLRLMRTQTADALTPDLMLAATAWRQAASIQMAKGELAGALAQKDADLAAQQRDVSMANARVAVLGRLLTMGCKPDR